MNPSSKNGLPAKDFQQELVEASHIHQVGPVYRIGKPNYNTAHGRVSTATTPNCNPPENAVGVQDQQILDDTNKMNDDEEPEEPESELWVYAVALVLFLVTTAGLSCIILFVFGAADNGGK